MSKLNASMIRTRHSGSAKAIRSIPADKILLISPDERLLKRFKGMLEESGYIVLLSTSLEGSFLEVGQSEPFLVLVDRKAIPDQLWQAEKFLGWFHHRSPVWLLCRDGCPGLERAYDRCFSRSVKKKTLLGSIEKLRSR